MKSLFHVTGSVPMDVGHLLLLARLSGTLCPRTCGTRRFLRTVTGSHWRRFLRSTSVFSALEVFYENALYKSTFDILTFEYVFLVAGAWVTLRILSTPTALQRTIGSQVIDKVRREWRDIGVILSGILPYISVVVVRDGHQASKLVNSFLLQSLSKRNDVTVTLEHTCIKCQAV